jgi:hypothetical protein
MMVNNNLVGGIPTPLKNMSSSVGMMTFPIYGKKIQVFQTTNQIFTETQWKMEDQWDMT